MIEKIKVISVTSDVGIGGTARQLYTIDRYLNKDYFEHIILCFHTEDTSRLSFFKDSQIYVMSSPEEMADYINKSDAFLVYCHRHGKNEPKYDEIAKRLSPEKVLIELNTFSAKDNGDFGQRINKIVFVSQTNLLKYCVQNNLPFDFNKLKTVYALVDAENFLTKVPTAQELADYRKKLGLDGYYVVGRIARAVMGKWDNRLMLFWQRLSRADKKIKFLIYGVPDSKKKKLTDLGLADNLIILPPTVNDRELVCFYSAIDVLVHASPVGECSCANIAEAMLFKKPIVVTSTPFPKRTYYRSHTNDNGQVEQIENGKNGFVVKSVLAMVEAVLHLKKESTLSQSMGELNQQEVIDRYNATVGIRTLEKIFIEGLKDRQIELSPELQTYDESLKFYPAEAEIRQWFKEYYHRLEKLYGPKRDSCLTKLILFYWRRLATIKRIVFRKV
jgi:glycosyltransferase involved in cell wall biosynthesis